MVGVEVYMRVWEAEDRQEEAVEDNRGPEAVPLVEVEVDCVLLRNAPRNSHILHSLRIAHGYTWKPHSSDIYQVCPPREIGIDG